MNLKKILFSFKATAILISLLIFVLFLRVILPQENIISKEEIEKIEKSSLLFKFIFTTLGLKNITTSFIFFSILFLFYLNLLYLVIKFVKVSIMRVKNVPKKWSDWENFELKKDSKERLMKYGFSFKEIGLGAIWGVRNRYSPIGFMLFHLSLFLFLTGGILIFLTRWSGEVYLLRNYPFMFDIDEVNVTRKGKIPPPNYKFFVVLNEVEAKKEGEYPIKLKTSLNFSMAGNGIEKISEINKPAKFLGFSFLPITKDSGFILTLLKEGKEKEKIFILSKMSSKKIERVDFKKNFTVVIDGEKGQMKVIQEGQEFCCQLKKGERIRIKESDLIISGIEDWVLFLVVFERGASFLIIGFILSITGLSIRFIFPRQDIIIEGDRIYFKGEYFPNALRSIVMGA